MKKIIYLSLVDWFWIKQRPQHMTELLSKNNKVTYICKMPWKKNTNAIISHSLNDNDLHKEFISRNNNMKIIRKKGVPKENKFKIIRYINSKLFKSYLLKLDKLNKYDIVVLTNPNQYEFIPNEFLNNKVFIYDCMDDYKSWPGCDKNKLVMYEKKVINMSNIVIVSSDELYNNMLKYDLKLKHKTYVINNGVDIKSFNKNNLRIENEVNVIKNNNRKKVGYIGTISTWVDLNLIKNIALKYNKLDFYIVGPVEQGMNIDEYKNIKNIIFTGSQPYYSIPNILDKLDVAIMPFKKIDLIKSVNPVKIYEYLAMGKPVIALKYKETEKFGNLIYTYDSEDDFMKVLEIALNDNNELLDERIKFAKLNSWEKRAEEFDQLVNGKERI